MNDIAGYLTFRGDGKLEGRPGLVYNYILTGNGLMVDCCGRHIAARVPAGPGKMVVRGLSPLDTHLTLQHGRIPGRLFELVLSVMLARPEVEVYIGIAWDGKGYRLVIPNQESKSASVCYETSPGVIVELHSHGAMGPGFSCVDNHDEQGLKIFGVVGDLLDDTPALNLRVGVYGYFMPVRWSDVFQGTLSGITDVYGLDNVRDKDKRRRRGIKWPRR